MLVSSERLKRLLISMTMVIRASDVPPDQRNHRRFRPRSGPKSIPRSPPLPAQPTRLAIRAGHFSLTARPGRLPSPPRHNARVQRKIKTLAHFHHGVDQGQGRPPRSKKSSSIPTLLTPKVDSQISATACSPVAGPVGSDQPSFPERRAPGAHRRAPVTMLVSSGIASACSSPSRW